MVILYCSVSLIALCFCLTFSQSLSMNSSSPLGSNGFMMGSMRQCSLDAQHCSFMPRVVEIFEAYRSVPLPHKSALSASLYYFPQSNWVH